MSDKTTHYQRNIMKTKKKDCKNKQETSIENYLTKKKT